MTGGNTPERGRQSGGRALGAFSWTSSYCGGGVKGSMEGGGTFLFFQKTWLFVRLMLFKGTEA